jgi:hypothetical protein
MIAAGGAWLAIKRSRGELRREPGAEPSGDPARAPAG